MRGGSDVLSIWVVFKSQLQGSKAAQSCGQLRWRWKIFTNCGEKHFNLQFITYKKILLKKMRQHFHWRIAKKLKLSDIWSGAHIHQQRVKSVWLTCKYVTLSSDYVCRWTTRVNSCCCWQMCFDYSTLFLCRNIPSIFLSPTMTFLSSDNRTTTKHSKGNKQPHLFRTT